MTPQIVGEAVGNNTPLREHPDTGWNRFLYRVDKQRIVRAAEYQRINLRVGVKQSPEIALYKISSSRRRGACEVTVIDGCILPISIS